MKHTQAKRKQKPFYVIKNDLFPDFCVQFTYNGWWIDRAKVEKLIEGFRAELNDIEACGYAGISEQDLHYFIKIHPEFSKIRKACKCELSIRAKLALKANIDTKYQWYLERRRKDEYNTRIETTGAHGAPLQPSDNTFVLVDMSIKEDESETALVS
ncbi:MAG: hypothetical protein AAGA35_02145 [Patescibacteria group bacterium]